MMGFPFFTDEEVVLIAWELGEGVEDVNNGALGKLVREGKEVRRFVESSRLEISNWKKAGRPRELVQRIAENLKKVRHSEKLRRAWKKIEALTNRFRDEYELVIEAFAPGVFDSKSRFLGDAEGYEFLLPDLVKPFLGKAWELDHFEVAVPDGTEDVEFEVSDPDGELVFSKRFAGGAKLEVPFAEVGMVKGGMWTWCLSYPRDGEFSVSRGSVSLVDAVDRMRIERLLAFSDRETSESGGSLMRALVLMEFDCFDGAIRVLREAVSGNTDPEFRREAFLLLHRTYSKVRSEYLSLGLESEANDALKAVISVEGELEKLSTSDE